MSEPIISRLSDPDMQAAPIALARAAQRAREIARQTGTALVIVRDGVLIEEPVTETNAKFSTPTLSSHCPESR